MKKRVYECMILFRPDVADTEKEKVFQKMTETLGKGNGTLSKSQIGKKQLAYPIAKQQEADYWIATIESTSLPKEMNEKLRFEASVLRHLMLRKD